MNSDGGRLHGVFRIIFFFLTVEYLPVAFSVRLEVRSKKKKLTQFTRNEQIMVLKYFSNVPNLFFDFKSNLITVFSF